MILLVHVAAGVRYGIAESFQAQRDTQNQTGMRYYAHNALHALRRRERLGEKRGAGF